MKAYAILNIVGGALLGVAAFAIPFGAGGWGRYEGKFFATAICMSISSIGLFIGGIILLAADHLKSKPQAAADIEPLYHPSGAPASEVPPLPGQG